MSCGGIACGKEIKGLKLLTVTIWGLEFTAKGQTSS